MKTAAVRPSQIISALSEIESAPTTTRRDTRTGKRPKGEHVEDGNSGPKLLVTAQSHVDMTHDQLADILAHPYWRHRIALGDGHYTPGQKDASDWGALGLPEDLSGRTFLDVGAFDGLHSFEAERRGAERVLATDIWADPDYDHEWWDNLRPGKEGFNLAHGYLDSAVESETIGVESIDPETVGTFDVVLCSGVIYHVKEPYSAIENLVSVTDELLVIESNVAHSLGDEPAMLFTAGASRDRNPSNWWAPSPAGLAEMMGAAGCQTVAKGHPPVRETPSPVPSRGVGHLTEPATVYRSPELDEPVDDLSGGGLYRVLYCHPDADRIEYRDGDAKRQGWVSREVFVRHNGQLPKHVLASLQYEGPRTFLNRAVNRLRNRSTTKTNRITAHGRV